MTARRELEDGAARRGQIRLLPAPRSAPPFDDELGRVPELASAAERSSAVQGVQGALALAFVLPSGLPVVPDLPPRLRVVGRDLARPTRSTTPAAGVDRPDVARWAAMVVQAAVEVVAGQRPLTQLVRWTTAEVYEQLQWRRQRQARRGQQSAQSQRAVVSSVHVCRPDDAVAEACAIVRVGTRASAVAIRIEAERETWRCTAITIG